MEQLLKMIKEFFIVFLLLVVPIVGTIYAINNYLWWKDDYYCLGIDLINAAWYYLSPYLFSIFVLIVYKRTRR